MTGRGTRRAAWWATVVILTVAMLAALGIGLWQAVEARQLERADDSAERRTVLEFAESTTVSLLSYTPDDVESQLHGNLSLLTGDFKESYTKLIEDTVIPGAREQNITAVAQVPAVGVETLSRDRAAILVYINQKVTPGAGAPNETASSVRMGLQKVGGEWLVDTFEPI
jgi:Mce-associated membrane protein